MENQYVRQHDARLIEKLRQNAKIDDVARAVADKLKVDNAELLLRTRSFGITPDTSAAFLLAPLVEVAWAGGKVRKRQRRAVLRIARTRGVEPGTPSYAQLCSWLTERPPKALFKVSLQVIAYGLDVLPANERRERIEKLVDWCHDVAKESGIGFPWALFVTEPVAPAEASVLEAISKALHRHE